MFASVGRAQSQLKRVETTVVRDLRILLAIAKPVGRYVHGRVIENVPDRVRVAVDVPDQDLLPVGSGRDRALAEENLAPIPGISVKAVGRVVSRHGEQNEEIRDQDQATGRDQAVAREIGDDRDRMFPGGAAGDETVSLDHVIVTESLDPSRDNRTIAMVRSRHIDTGIESELLLAKGCMQIYSVIITLTEHNTRMNMDEHYF